MGSADKWSTAAAETCKRVSRIWQRGNGTRSSRGYRNEQCIPAICHILMLFVSVAMFTSSLLLLQSLRSNQAICFVPRSSNWGSILSANNTLLPIPHKSDEAEDLSQANGRAWLLEQSRENGTTRCHDMRTARSLLFGLDQLAARGGNIRLQTDQNHQILLVSYTEDGDRRCSGGDFYETDLSGPRWKSRPTVKDLGDGSYTINLSVDGRVTGLYTFKVVLLFDNLHGLDASPDPWVLAKEVIRLRIEFVDDLNSTLQSDLQLCGKGDFERRSWRGRWTRAKAMESCSADEGGRFRCLDPLEPCEAPWCEGPVGSLESNGWVYSAHCAFRIFTQQRAWDCLDQKWLFFWGDSNHQDTIRNLLNFVLGRQDGNVQRKFESFFSNPSNSSQELKITSFFNGHYDEQGNDLGLASLDDADYRERLVSYFLPSNPTLPHAIILNSGLHDGRHWANLTHYVAGAQRATGFWGSIWRNSRAELSARPRILYRTTVAPAGEHRNKPANPHKMEVYNTVLGEMIASELGSAFASTVDEYDMTFPWHFDNQCSDGAHYGRPPSRDSWMGSQKGHQYFVDIMLAHVLLNNLCPL